MERMTGDELKTIAIALLGGREEGWQAGLARLLSEKVGGRYDRQRVHQWSSGITPVPRLIAALLRALKEIDMLKRSVPAARRATKTTILAAVVAGLVAMAGDGRAQQFVSPTTYPLSWLIHLPAEMGPECKLAITMRVQTVAPTEQRQPVQPHLGAEMLGEGAGAGGTSALARSVDGRPVAITGSTETKITVIATGPGGYDMTVSARLAAPCGAVDNNWSASATPIKINIAAGKAL